MRKKFGLDGADGSGSATASPTKTDGAPRSKRGRPPKAGLPLSSPSPKKKGKGNSEKIIGGEADVEMIKSEDSESPRRRPSQSSASHWEDEETPSPSPRKKSRNFRKDGPVVSKSEAEIVLSDIGSSSPTCRVNFLQDAGFDSDGVADLTLRKPIKNLTSTDSSDDDV